MQWEVKVLKKKEGMNKSSNAIVRSWRIVVNTVRSCGALFSLVVEKVEWSLDGVATKNVNGRGAYLSVAKFHGDADLAPCFSSVSEAQVKRQGSKQADSRISHKLYRSKNQEPSKWFRIFAVFGFVTQFLSYFKDNQTSLPGRHRCRRCKRWE